MYVKVSHEMSAKFQAAINCIILKNNTSTWVRFPTDTSIHVVKDKKIAEYKNFILLSYLQHSNLFLSTLRATRDDLLHCLSAILHASEQNLLLLYAPRIVKHGSSSSLRDVPEVHYLSAIFLGISMYSFMSSAGD